MSASARDSARDSDRNPDHLLHRPTAKEVELALRLLEPWRLLTSPTFVGIDEIPDERPLLFVGNHSIYGLLDLPLMFAELYQRRGIFLRGLGDHAHFTVPLWRDLLVRFGAVDGTRENCARLMAAGEAILVFPGGGREVAKRKGERYQLLWKQRLGFARLAIEQGCTIIPFAAVGMDDVFDILVDGDEILRSPLGGLMRRLGIRDDIVMPIPSPRISPERLYFQFCPAVPVHSYERQATEAACVELRDRVKAAVEKGLAELKALRAGDPDRLLPSRIRGAVKRLFGNRVVPGKR